MRVTLRDTESLRPYQRNPRKNDAAVEAVAKSITEFGFRQPIVVDKVGVIIVGHVRWKAAKKLGLTRVPVHVARNLTPAQIRAYRLADNRTAEAAAWDAELLPLEMQALQEDDYDLAFTAFSAKQIAELLGRFETELEPLSADPGDRGTATIIRCPKCGHEFARERER